MIGKRPGKLSGVFFGSPCVLEPHGSQPEGYWCVAGVRGEVRDRAVQNGCGVRFFATTFEREIGRSEKVHQNTLGLAG